MNGEKRIERSADMFADRDMMDPALFLLLYFINR